jgi:Membrane-bound lysozyme-inhibitor of c-type lysozyme
MRLLPSVLAAMLLAAGCRSAESPHPASLAGTASVTENPRPAGPAAGSEPLRVSAFDCDGGLGFVMAQVAGSAGTSEAIDLVLPDRRHRLVRAPTTSGARYAHGGIAVFSKGPQAILDLDGRVYRCVENPQRSIVEDKALR